MSEVTKHESDSRKSPFFLLKRKTNQRKQLPRCAATIRICLFISLSVPCGRERRASSGAPVGDGHPGGSPACVRQHRHPWPPHTTPVGTYISPGSSQGTLGTAGGRRTPRGPGACTHSPNKAHETQGKPPLTPVALAAKAQHTGGRYLPHLPVGGFRVLLRACG